jgi:hypothetical protein
MAYTQSSMVRNGVAIMHYKNSWVVARQHSGSFPLGLPSLGFFAKDRIPDLLWFGIEGCISEQVVFEDF